MSNFAYFEITGSLETGLRFQEFPDALRDGLRTEIEAIAREAFSAVAALVPHRTGELAARERLRLFESENSVGAVIDFDGGDPTSSDHAKAGAQEYGSRGRPIEVRANVSHISKVFGRALSAPVDRLQRAYERTPTIRAQPFVRPVVASMQTAVLARLERIVETAVNEVND